MKNLTERQTMAELKQELDEWVERLEKDYKQPRKKKPKSSRMTLVKNGKRLVT